MTRRSFREKLQAWPPLIPLYLALHWAKWRSKRPPFWRTPGPWGRGISVLIPECGTPDLLAGTLAHASAALARLEEPGEIVVQVNGAPREDYALLEQAYPDVVWRFERDALGFNGAIETGLLAVRYPAVYLLNSDMRIAEDALLQLLPYRMPSAFALGSQIFFADSKRRREETGWCDFYTDGARAIIYDKTPDDNVVARGSLYAGGGSALFRTELLREYVRDAHAYSPFYWEDADWGTRAWAEGLECVFVPGSVAIHEHRGTIKRRFSEAEVNRIIARNALLFELRHHFNDIDGFRGMGEAARQDALTRREISGVGTAIHIARVRGRSDAMRRRGFRFTDVLQKYYAPGWQQGRPTVIWLTPFAIFPPAHGGARRIAELAKRLREHVNLVLLSDEANLYKDCDPQALACFHAVHVLQGRKDQAGQALQDLATRLANHAPALLRSELNRLQQQYQADLVQVEFMEAAGFIEERKGQIPFIASLHDVYLNGGTDDAQQLALLRRYDHVVATSAEDAHWLQGLPVSIVGNGAVDRYSQSLPSPASKRVLFMGPFRYKPNYDGILAFLQQVWPSVIAAHPGAELVILGGQESCDASFRHQALQQQGVQLVSEFVDPVPVLAACALTINPQQEIRGSALKVAESLLARRICVSTTQGARGFDTLDTRALRICPTWQHMTAELITLLGNDALRHELEQSSEEVRTALSWDGKANELLTLYQQLLPARFGKEKAA